MSLDGYIAGPNGEHDWIIMDPAIDFKALFQSFDTVLLGRRTFEASRAMGGNGGMPGMTAYVVSRTLRPEDFPGVNILSDASSAIPALQAQPGKDIWLMGGGGLFRSLLEAGLVDTVEVAVIPVLLGQGIPLLPGLAGRARLELTGTQTYPTGIVSLNYSVQKAAEKTKKRKKAA